MNEWIHVLSLWSMCLFGCWFNTMATQWSYLYLLKVPTRFPSGTGMRWRATTSNTTRFASWTTAAITSPRGPSLRRCRSWWNTTQVGSLQANHVCACVGICSSLSLELFFPAVPLPSKSRAIHQCMQAKKNIVNIWKNKGLIPFAPSPYGGRWGPNMIQLTIAQQLAKKKRLQP